MWVVVGLNAMNEAHEGGGCSGKSELFLVAFVSFYTSQTCALHPVSIHLYL